MSRWGFLLGTSLPAPAGRRPGGLQRPHALHQPVRARGRQTVEAFRRLRPGVRVDWLRDGTNQIPPRLRADVLLADALTFDPLGARAGCVPAPR